MCIKTTNRRNNLSFWSFGTKKCWLIQKDSRVINLFVSFNLSYGNIKRHLKCEWQKNTFIKWSIGRVNVCNSSVETTNDFACLSLEKFDVRFLTWLAKHVQQCFNSRKSNIALRNSALSKINCELNYLTLYIWENYFSSWNFFIPHYFLSTFYSFRGFFNW